MLRHRRRQRGVGAALAVEVGPHRQHDDRPPAGDRGGVDQVGEEGLAGRLVVAEREDLLELVDSSTTRRVAGASRRARRVVRWSVFSSARSRAHQALHRDGRRLAAVEPRQRDGQALERVVPRLEDDDGPVGAAVELPPPQARGSARPWPATTCRCPRRRGSPGTGSPRPRGRAGARRPAPGSTARGRRRSGRAPRRSSRARGRGTPPSSGAVPARLPARPLGCRRSGGETRLRRRATFGTRPRSSPAGRSAARPARAAGLPAGGRG